MSARMSGNRPAGGWHKPRPALSRGDRAEWLPGCYAQLRCCLPTGLLLSSLSPHHGAASSPPSLLIFSVFPFFSLLLFYFLFFAIFFFPFSKFLSPFISHVGIFHSSALSEEKTRGGRHTMWWNWGVVSFPFPFPSGLGSNPSAFLNIALHRRIQSSWSDTHEGRAWVSS
jgi:hypothetical protein